MDSIDNNNNNNKDKIISYEEYANEALRLIDEINLSHAQDSKNGNSDNNNDIDSNSDDDIDNYNHDLEEYNDSLRYEENVYGAQIIPDNQTLSKLPDNHNAMCLPDDILITMTFKILEAYETKYLDTDNKSSWMTHILFLGNDNKNYDLQFTSDSISIMMCGGSEWYSYTLKEMVGSEENNVYHKHKCNDDGYFKITKNKFIYLGNNIDETIDNTKYEAMIKESSSTDHFTCPYFEYCSIGCPPGRDYHSDGYFSINKDKFTKL